MKSINAVLCILMTLLVCASCAKLKRSVENEIKNAFAATENCDCKRGFCEEDETGKNVCKCLPEYGLRGENECRKCHCGKDANCTISSGFFIITTCICPEGYSDKLLRGCKGDCNGEPCKNGGTCSVVGDDIECQCVPPYYGENCERNRCKEKCGDDKNMKCDGDLTNDEDIICSCEENIMFWNEDDKTCKDRCKEKCGDNENVKCDGDFKNDEDITCSCEENTMFWNEDDKTCKDRCKEKCGDDENVKCDGDLTKDEDIMCSCEDNTMFWNKDDKTCKDRCREKCGDDENVKCDGDLTKIEDIICSCEDNTMFWNKDDKLCKDRCKEKCGDEQNVKCDGDLMKDEDIICSCEENTMFWNKDDKTCKDRCKEKCGDERNVKCDGDLTKDEDITCSCEDNTMFWSKDDKTCKKNCDCKNGFCKEDENGKNVCKCPPEYGLRGENECRKCHCGKGANCTISSGFFVITTCICPEGYSDELLRGCKGDCSGEPCKNEGMCKVVGDDIECMCVPPYFGNNCERDFLEKSRRSRIGEQEDD